MYTYIEMEKRRAHLVPPTNEREKIEGLARLKEKKKETSIDPQTSSIPRNSVAN